MHTNNDWFYDYFIDELKAIGNHSKCEDGKSAYQFAQEGGYTGTEEEFAARMAAEIPTVDSTLDKSGQAADAAVVGNRFSALPEEIVTTSESKVASHNTGTDTHSDIRLLIQGLTERLNALADSDDTTLDQLSEVVAYIKANRDLISSITTDKVSVADIIDNLTSNVPNKPLSAAQGVVIKTLIDALRNDKLDAAELTSAINTALTQAKESGDFNGKDGTSVTVKSVSESTEDGGSNVITFSDGNSVTIKNGNKGKDAESYTIPDYWQEYLDGKIETIKALQDTGGKNCVSFVVITDLHYYSNLGKCSPSLAKKIMDACDIKYAVVLGDTENRGSWSTKELAEAEFVNVAELLEPIKDRMLRTQGNHDGSWGETLNGVTYPYNYTPDELYNRIYRGTYLIDGVYADDTGTGYYVDDAAGKFRYIVLNTHCNEYALNDDGSAKYNNIDTFRFTQSQYDFLIDALANVPDGYSVAVFGHVPICDVYADNFGGSNGDHVVMRNLLTAYKKKTSYSGSFAGTAISGSTSAYTNLAGTITNDVRLSSSGATKASAGAAVTDFIACSVGDVLRVKGLNITSAPLPDGTNSPAIAVYDSNKANISVIYSASTHLAAFSTDTDGSTMYTLFHNSSGNQIESLANAAYIRICGTPVEGEDIIVTLNEQIIETSGSAYDAVSVSADFTAAKGEFIAYFSGHMHADYLYGNSGFGIDIITTRCDGHEENNSTLYAERVAGTTTEQSFDVFTVNTAEKKIYATKIGAGDDRVINYSGAQH